jgi:hypothetical protein
MEIPYLGREMEPNMFIQTESTPNPATLKFLPGLTVLEDGTADFPSADGTESSPLAQRILRYLVFRVCFWAVISSPSPKTMRGMGSHQTVPVGRDHGTLPIGPALHDGAGAAEHGDNHDGADAEIVGQIKELLDTACVQRWPKTAGTSHFMALNAASFICK